MWWVLQKWSLFLSREWVLLTFLVLRRVRWRTRICLTRELSLRGSGTARTSTIERISILQKVIKGVLFLSNPWGKPVRDPQTFVLVKSSWSGSSLPWRHKGLAAWSGYRRGRQRYCLYCFVLWRLGFDWRVSALLPLVSIMYLTQPANFVSGLLALGNVISALSETGANRHIPYRDSKITRLLQGRLAWIHQN